MLIRQQKNIESLSLQLKSNETGVTSQRVWFVIEWQLGGGSVQEHKYRTKFSMNTSTVSRLGQDMITFLEIQPIQPTMSRHITVCVWIILVRIY